MEDANSVLILDPNGQSGGSKTTTETVKKDAKVRSIVWQHFSKIIDEDGSCCKCQCNHCRKFFTCSKKSGTTHLLRHISDGICPVLKSQPGADAILSGRKRRCPEPRTGHSLLKFDQWLQQNRSPRNADVLPPGLEARPIRSMVNDDDGGGGLLISEFRNCMAKLESMTKEKIHQKPSADVVSPPPPPPPDYSLSAAVKCLNEMDDIPMTSEMYLDAFEILQDGGERECFICLPAEPRRRWLQRMLHRRHPFRYASNL
ncbi:hypothetical protein M569_00330 [Genlisea aurea]|uniref:BED-type domain-containing protein n=1 Tax=Genlisea aurea TaxID=192259 RepID=S8D4W4_9LAMI|nr:hypothetical protein M569_00330 [Genlisea aurea]